MNKDKIIKDLKEKNRKLKNQYELQETRLYSSQHKVDKLKQENERLNNIIKEIKEICKNYEKYKEQWFEEECKDALDDISGLMYEKLKEGK